MSQSENPASSTPVVSDPRREYISATLEYCYFIGDRALPQSIDDAERDFGLEIYDRMMNEPVIGGHIDLLRIKTLENGLTVEPFYICEDLERATPEEKARHEASERVADYVRFVLSGLEDDDFSGLGDVLWDMLEAIYKGHRLAEVTTELATFGPFSGLERFESIKAKPRENYAFVVDGMNRFRGVMAVMPGKGITVRQGLIFDLGSIPNSLNPDKLFVLSFGARGGNPQGRSWLRPAYAPWYEKQLARVEELKYIGSHAGGKVSGTTAENASSSDASKTPEEEMLDDLVQWANGGAIALKYGATVQAHYPPSGSSPFDAFIDRRDKEMVLAIVKAIRATMEAQHGSRADSSTGENLLDAVVGFIRTKLCDAFSRVLRRVVLRNLGESALETMPSLAMSKVEKPDFATTVTALSRVGYRIHSSQFPGFDRAIGAPQRAEGWDEDPDPETAPNDQENQDEPESNDDPRR